MNKRDIVKDMSQACDGAMFITRKRLAEYLGMKRAESVDKYIIGLDRVERLYFIPDVVENMMKFKERR